MDFADPTTITAPERAELDALTAEHGRRAALTRNTIHSAEAVRLVPRWYGSARPCDEPAASDRWEDVTVDAARYPALASRLAAEDEALHEEHEAQSREEERTAVRSLNSRRIDAANALHDADAHLRGLLARWGERCMAGIAGRPPTTWTPEDDAAALAAIDAAKAARADAQRAADDAEEEWSAAVTAERIEAEDAARI